MRGRIWTGVVFLLASAVPAVGWAGEIDLIAKVDKHVPGYPKNVQVFTESRPGFTNSFTGCDHRTYYISEYGHKWFSAHTAAGNQIGLAEYQIHDGQPRYEPFCWY